MSDTPTALEIIIEALPADPEDGLAVVGYDDHDDSPTWGEPEVVAERIYDALVEAGYLNLDEVTE